MKSACSIAVLSVAPTVPLDFAVLAALRATVARAAAAFGVIRAAAGAGLGPLESCCAAGEDAALTAVTALGTAEPTVADSPTARTAGVTPVAPVAAVACGVAGVEKAGIAVSE